jgi:hypothetical protein
MLAIRVPYPFPDGLPLVESLETLKNTGRIVEFPDRHISYVLNCRISEVEAYIPKVIKAVESLPRGQEPNHLELRLA